MIALLRYNIILTINKLFPDAEFLFVHSECKILNLTNWHSVYYRILPKNKSLFGGQAGECIFAKKPIKSAKTLFF